MSWKLLRGRPAALVVAGGVLAISIGGFAVAAIPSADGTINGCYTISNTGDNIVGKLRIIDPTKAACSYNEKAISWNQQGQPGVAGPSGPAGPTGSTGPAGAPGSPGAQRSQRASRV